MSVRRDGAQSFGGSVQTSASPAWRKLLKDTSASIVTACSIHVRSADAKTSLARIEATSAISFNAGLSASIVSLGSSNRPSIIDTPMRAMRAMSTRWPSSCPLTLDSASRSAWEA